MQNSIYVIFKFIWGWFQKPLWVSNSVCVQVPYIKWCLCIQP